MNKENIEKRLQEAEDYLSKTLIPQYQSVGNAIEQVKGRIQVLRELLADFSEEES